MTNLTELQNLVDRFHANIDFYKDARNAYNEHSCRIEYIDPLLKLLGWDVANEKGLAPNIEKLLRRITPLELTALTIPLRSEVCLNSL